MCTDFDMNLKILTLRAGVVVLVRWSEEEGAFVFSESTLTSTHLYLPKSLKHILHNAIAVINTVLLFILSFKEK